MYFPHSLCHHAHLCRHPLFFMELYKSQLIMYLHSFPGAFLIALRSKAIVFSFKHRISDVFTSGDVSLHKIVIFLKPFETCQILVWITKGDIRFYSEISNVYMWHWGWYFQIVFNEYQHWTFPKHNYKRVVTVTPSVMILDNSEREMFSQEIFSCIILCAIYATTYTIRSNFTLGTLMTSAAADVISHNGRKIGRFKPRWFCHKKMPGSAWKFA